MTTHLMATSTIALGKLATLTAIASALVAAPAWAQHYPVTTAQKQTANVVAQSGVPLSELAANAPERYTVKSGDTLWAISRLYLKSPWRWPELWGMNLNDIKNPHRIYPGQVLVLERMNGMASLRLEAEQNAEPPTVRVSPRTRYETLSDSALPTLRSHIIEAFLAEPIVVDDAGLKAAPRIVSALESRVLITRGDRAYARGSDDAPLLDDQGKDQFFRVFRNATPLKDPDTGEVLGYEAQYVGKALLVRGEGTADTVNRDGSHTEEFVPATIDIISAKEEIRVGDRLIPEPARQMQTYTPRAPEGKVEGRIVSVYGNAVLNAGQNQVVAINRGTADGMEPGVVLAILKDGARKVDRTGDTPITMKLPDERNGLMMVFRTFERVSYALILEITDGVQVGDRLVNPRQ
ncbi:MAG: LysM peptidoglycan-binding domain-containing protein [Burkholderiales bacterium]|uniref:LysM peptidoglycan-binding domain-containing protein n=1 Tax=Candidatus Aalborgicola defluviihabitans TaxID=3386187 RepID=UPI001D339CCD|nr:LysM peptidoglycan-binding domain-containing protein [Burkholderiales bacterium]MBK6570424.1 LysM peptidoglycan-binding domain-containing protein [Burkholderiales bacterium]MBL0243696.1 LysM peptidoglycan-binding domain-containing protein [Rhodoferax sp.]